MLVEREKKHFVEINRKYFWGVFVVVFIVFNYIIFIIIMII